MKILPKMPIGLDASWIWPKWPFSIPLGGSGGAIFCPTLIHNKDFPSLLPLCIWVGLERDHSCYFWGKGVDLSVCIC